jgi:hypothetical protein
MSRIRRNETCPCGSGKKFKQCCLRRATEVVLQPHFVPFLSFPFSFSMAVTLISPKVNFPRFAPLLCFGGTFESVNFFASGDLPNPDQFMRFGLCNGEVRPIVQLRTTVGLFECTLNETLRPGYYAFDVNFDNAASRIKLFVNGKLLQSAPFQGEIDYSRARNCVFGIGLGNPIQCIRVQRYLLTQDHIDKLSVVVPADMSAWTENEQGYDRITHITESPSVAYTFLSKNTVRHKNQKLSIARAIIESAGHNSSEYRLGAELTHAAGVTISSIADAIQNLLNDESTHEPDLLSFFHKNPAAAFLLEPAACRQFREEAIQGYGRIDFVFESSDGSFRVVEIESPQATIFVRSDDFSQPMNHALGQVRKWIRGAKLNPVHLQNRFGKARALSLIGIVVIGRRKQIDTIQKDEQWAEIQNDIRCLTWDDIVNRGRLLAEQLFDPKVRALEWE